MAFLNTFSTRSADRRPLAHGCIQPGGGRRPGGGKVRRRAGEGGIEFLLASAVLGFGRGLHRRGLMGAQGFGVALALAERLSARGIAKWRAARHWDASKRPDGP